MKITYNNFFKTIEKYHINYKCICFNKIIFNINILVKNYEQYGVKQRI